MNDIILTIIVDESRLRMNEYVRAYGHAMIL